MSNNSTAWPRTCTTYNTTRSGKSVVFCAANAPWRWAAKTGASTTALAQLKVRMNKSSVDGAMAAAYRKILRG